MLPPAMRRLASRRLTTVLACALAAVATPVALGGCGDDDEPETEVVEGEPLELGELSYNIQITRFLNPADNEDTEYLLGQPEPPPGTGYLGVFLVIENESEEPHESADAYVIRDTQHEEFEPVESESPYALEIGAEVPAEGQLPLEDTTAQTGPNQGSLLIFLVSDEASENRPLKLEIDSAEGSGEVVLDL
jgi:hypothetical protein